MANDGFAGTAVLVRLLQWLAVQDTFYSYRLVIGPEHLGTVFYLRDRPRADVDQMVGGIFEEMPGTAAAAQSDIHLPRRAFLDRAITKRCAIMRARTCSSLARGRRATTRPSGRRPATRCPSSS